MFKKKVLYDCLQKTWIITAITTVFLALNITFLCFLGDVYGKIATCVLYGTAIAAVAVIFLCNRTLNKRYQTFVKLLSSVANMNFDEQAFIIPPFMKFSKELFLIKQINDILTNREHELLKQQADIKALENQINPHFLYNTLDCLRAEAVMSNNDTLANMIYSLSQMFRYSISNESDLVTIFDEISNVQHYFKIQQFRFENRFNLIIEVNPMDRTIMNCLIPKLTLQPIVENAFKYGFMNKMTDCVISLSFTNTKNIVTIKCSDNGNGMDIDKLCALQKSIQGDFQSLNQCETSNMSSSGIALKNISSRIKLYFGSNYGLQVHSIPGYGTDVYVFIPNSERSD